MKPSEPVEIHPYSAHWKTEFQRIGRDLRQALGDAAIRIDHIGSTSIVGLAAKSIIDVQVSVKTLESPFVAPMESLGYIWRKDNPDKTKRYFRESPGNRRTHIHIRKAGSWHEQFALLFRDYMRLHADDQRKYEAVKRALAATYRTERQRYTEAKDAVIWEIMQRADRWAAATGWELSDSDM
jgi:GrpB-like predicted nucleotidyltransferase (UPF0157 family)